MSARDLRSAWLSLRGAGVSETVSSPDDSAWWRCVAEILWGDASPDAELVREVKLGPLATAAQCAPASPAVLMDVLQNVPRGPQKSSVLIRLAQWWMTEFGECDSPDWGADLDHYRAGFRSIRGIGPETADRLLLFAANLPVFPIDRAILRIGVRHGWLDFPVDDEAAQSSFVSSLNGDVNQMRHAARELKAIGAEFCGRIPNCETCPLNEWLPEHGPLYIDQC